MPSRNQLHFGGGSAWKSHAGQIGINLWLIEQGSFFLLFSFFCWPARGQEGGVQGLRGARELAGCEAGAQVFTCEWASKQYTGGSSIAY